MTTDSQATLEANILGALMTDPDSLFRVSSLRPEMFVCDPNREIFEAILANDENRQPFDVVTLGQLLGNMPYLGDLVRNTVTTANVRHYAKLLEDAHKRRQVIAFAGELIDGAEELPVADLVDKAQQGAMDLSKQSYRDPTGIKDVLVRTVDALDNRFQNPDALSGASTGYEQIDERLMGLHPGNLIIIAARPSMGKTTLAMNIAETVSENQPVMVFSLEMTDEELSGKMICSMGRVDYGRYRSGKLNDDDWPKVTHAVSQISTRQLFIDDCSGLSVMQLRSKARRQHRKTPLGLIVVDYLQLMSGKGENRTQEISSISRGLKLLAKELNVPVIALSQLNRGLEQRSNKRPVMSDLRESGAIEQDADVIIFIYRDEIYHEDSPDKGTAEIITAKQRHGPTGVDRLTFLGHYCRFDNFVYRWGSESAA